MPSLSITKTYVNGNILFEQDLDNIRDDIETFVNTTKLDEDNLQDNAVTAQKLADGSVTNPKLAVNAVTNAKITTQTIAKDKLDLIAQSFLYRAGDMKQFHSYNGLLSPGQGWMLCDGRQITETNYNTEHGAGSYATFISPLINGSLVNKFLPAMDNKFAVGKNSTPQDGSIALTFEGNASHEVNLSHSHTVNSHNHQWYDKNPGTAAAATTFDASGSGITIGTAISPGGVAILASALGTDVDLVGASYTSNSSPGTNSGGSATQNIKPESLAVSYYMRIV